MKITHLLLALVALLLVVQIIDRAREPAQLGELTNALEATNATFDRLVSEQRDLRRSQARLLQALSGVRLDGSLVARSQEDTSQDPEAAAERDGIPRPGVNFLKPLDWTGHHPERIGGTLRSFSNDVPGTNDILTSYAITSQIHGMVNDSLCSATALEPDRWNEALATAVLINEDFTEFRFTLRKGVRWQMAPLASEPGFEWLRREQELTAHDFVFTLDMITHPTVECPQLKPYYEALDTYEAIDDHTLVIRWKESLYSNINFTLSLSPLPRHVYRFDADGQEMPEDHIPIAFNEHWFDARYQVIGVGRYRLLDYTPRQGMRFDRNQDYYGVPDHFEAQFWDTEIAAPEPRLVAFKNAQVHALGLRPSQYKADILDGHESRFAQPQEDDPKAGREGIFGWEETGSNSWLGIAWNCRRSQLADVRVRQALAHLYPFERIVESVFFGLAERSRGPVHPSSPYHNDAIEAFAYDPDRAVALLEEAGWVDTDGDGWRDKRIGGERVTLRLHITYYAENRVAANLLAQYQDACRAVGIDLAGDPVESQEWSRRADNRSYDGFFVIWSSGLTVDYKQLWHGDTIDQPRSSNLAQWSDDEADVLIDELRTRFDLEERYATSRRVQAIIYQQQPYLFASVSRAIFAWHNRRSDDADEREVLGGVTWALDHCHPLFSRARHYWYMLEP